MITSHTTTSPIANTRCRRRLACYRRARSARRVSGSFSRSNTGSHLSCRGGGAIDRRRQRRKWAGGEDRLDRKLEELGEPEGEREARVVVATLQVADRLVVDVDGLRQLLS